MLGMNYFLELIIGIAVQDDDDTGRWNSVFLQEIPLVTASKDAYSDNG
jgi:hypothetical protein